MEELIQYSLWKTPVLLMRTLIIYAMILSLTLLGENSGLCSNELGRYVPEGEINLMVGTSLEVFCILDLDQEQLEDYSAKDIIFYRNGSLIDQHNVNVINETTSRLYMENLTESKFWLLCKLKPNDKSKQNDTSIDRQDLLVAFKHVMIGTSPKSVKNFSCVNKNWESLNCSWTEPDNVFQTNYNISFKFKNKRFYCPENTRRSYCVWTRNSGLSYHISEIPFKMIGNNSLNTSTEYFNISNHACIIPNPPSLESVSNGTSSSIYLKLNFNGQFSYYADLINYKVLYKCENNLNSPVNISGNFTIKKDKCAYLNISDLPYPNMRYNFSVFIKTAAASDEKYWSAPAFGEFKTLSCPPYRSPKTDIGSFEIMPSSENRSVRVCWEPLQTFEYNGKNFSYEIRMLKNDSDGNSTKLSNYSCIEFTIDLEIHRFFVKSVNSEGSAKNASVIIVPGKSEIVDTCDSFIATNYRKGTYELSWEPPSKLAVQIANYTIFSCKSNQEDECDGPLNWQHFPSNVTKFNYSVDDPVAFYRFAVSVNTVNSSSGMKWTSCTVLFDKIGVVSDLDAVNIYSYSVDLKWSLNCKDKTRNIKGYNVFYYVSSSRNSTEYHNKVDVRGGINVTGATIKNLQPHTKYVMWMVILTDSNQGGGNSKEISFSTKEGPPDVSDVDLIKSNVTNTTAEISWNPPKNRNGELQFYEIYINETLTSNVSYGENRTLLPRLKSYRVYEVKLKACTSKCSDPSKPITFRTEIGIPSLVVNPKANFVNSQINVSWGAPEELSGPNPSYEVKYQEGDHNSVIKTNYTNVTISQPDCLPYEFRIRAINEHNGEVYAGYWSDAVPLPCYNGESMGLKVTVVIFVIFFIFIPLLLLCKKLISIINVMKLIPIFLPSKFVVKYSQNECRSDPEDECYHLLQMTVNNKEFGLERVDSAVEF